MLDRLLSPISSETFFSEFYERKHLLIRRQDPRYYADIVTLDQLDELLFSAALHHPAIRVVNHALPTFPEAKTYTVSGSTRIDPLKYTRQFVDGSTLAMAGLHEKLFGLRRLTNEMAATFVHPFQANVYLTPKNAQGFAPHYDTHDVFVLQFSGSKRWRIYENRHELAIKSMPFDKEKHAPGVVVAEFTLHAGDLLYIPRGLMHDANCEESHSGHVTLGLTGKTWAEYIAERVLRAAETKPALRRYPTFGRGPRTGVGMKDLIDCVSEIVRGACQDTSFVDEFLGRERSLAKGQLLQLLQLDGMDADARISIREKHQVRINREAENVSVRFYDNAVTVPASCDQFLHALFSSEHSVRIAEVDCELDDDSKVLLAKELARVGLVRVDPAN